MAGVIRNSALFSLWLNTMESLKELIEYQKFCYEKITGQSPRLLVYFIERFMAKQIEFNKRLMDLVLKDSDG